MTAAFILAAASLCGPMPQTRLMRVSGYCSCKVCCSPAARGITASGRPAIGRLAAADKSIPFGTRLYVPGYGACRVWDRGGAIRRNRLDLLLLTHKAALQWGVRWVKMRMR